MRTVGVGHNLLITNTAQMSFSSFNRFTCSHVTDRGPKAPAAEGMETERFLILSVHSGTLLLIFFVLLFGYKVKT